VFESGRCLQEIQKCISFFMSNFLKKLIKDSVRIQTMPPRDTEMYLFFMSNFLKKLIKDSVRIQTMPPRDTEMYLFFYV
jgi:hypothetical protein